MRQARSVTLVLGLLLAFSACTAPGARPVGPPLRNAVHRAPRVPDEADRFAARLAAHALVRDSSAVDVDLMALQAFDADRARPTGLTPAALDLRGASLESGRRHREAVAALLDRDDLDPALRRRLEHERDDDPLTRADARIRDARQISIARAFNTVAEPVGRSLLTTALAPVRLGRALLRYALDLYDRDPLPLQRRQALAHWKDFLARYPRAPEREEIELRVREADVLWRKTRRRQALEQAQTALAAENYREALVFADRALQYSPEHPEAERVLALASAGIEAQRAAFARSVEFTETPPVVDAETRALALAILQPTANSLASLSELGTVPANADAARFAETTLRAGMGHEQAVHEGLLALAERDSDEHAMARHASAALADPIRNPHDFFRAARSRDRLRRASWILFGPLAGRPPEASIQGVLETAADFPGVLQALLTLPLRVLQWPWMPPPPTAKTTALQAQRYLVRFPEGAQREEVLDWLADYERGRNNHVGALRIAEQRDPDGDHDALREDAARQALRVGLSERRLDVRRALLMGVTRRFPATEAGDEAGRLVRAEAEEYTPHRIQISRGFLEENRDVAGPDGLDLDPSLLDDDPTNGELHPEGVAWIGERRLELAYVGSSGDPDDEAQTETVVLSPERLSQLVARLEETSFRNALLDDEDPVIPNAQRDLNFERARLGLAESWDRRPTAHANFAYRGMRERYGVVRRREPILPFDLVVQGSLSDLSLGAFPRLREPEETEDAERYE